jgi:predicted kinase
MMKHVYVFRGAPASGKSTVVPLFCETLPKPVTLIEQDKFRWGIHTFGRKVSEVTDEDHALAYRVTVAAYEEYLKNGIHTIIVEGLFTYDDISSSQGNIRELRKLAEKYGYTFTSVVLTASKQELLTRNSERAYTVPDEEFEQLFNGVYGIIGDDEVVIDSNALSPQDTLGNVLRNTIK